MRIFLAGATGVMGKRLAPRLVEQGHFVVGTTRHESRTDELWGRNVHPVVVDALDRDRLIQAVVDAKPDVVIHQLSSIPQRIDPKKYDQQFAENDRLRVAGTDNLVEAAVAAGAKRIIAQSIAFAYAPVGDWVKTEEAPLFLDAPDPFGRGVRAIHHLEQTVLGASGVEGLVLRYGFFYGPWTTYASEGGHMAKLVRRRRFPIVGGGTGTFSFVHIDDAAQATVWALSRGAPGIYNITDTEPAAVHEWLPRYAERLKAPKPFRVPAAVAKVLAGPYAVYLSTRLRGASSLKAQRELGWEPRFFTWRVGFLDGLG